jgi:hypothetical protein
LNKRFTDNGYFLLGIRVVFQQGVMLLRVYILVIPVVPAAVEASAA